LRRLVDAVIMYVLDNADDLAPVVGVSDSYPLAQRIARVMPILTREILRDDRYRALVIDVGPGEIAASYDARA
jgi:hypothetical protein